MLRLGTILLAVLLHGTATAGNQTCEERGHVKTYDEAHHTGQAHSGSVFVDSVRACGHRDQNPVVIWPKNVTPLSGYDAWSYNGTVVDLPDCSVLITTGRKNIPYTCARCGDLIWEEHLRRDTTMVFVTPDAVWSDNTLGSICEIWRKWFSWHPPLILEALCDN